MPRGHPHVVAGIDLAGSPRRATGVCILRGNRAETCVALSDDEILEAIRMAAPAIVPMDAPLSLPAGRRTIHDRRGEHLVEAWCADARHRVPPFCAVPPVREPLAFLGGTSF